MTSRFTIAASPIKGCCVISRKPIGDNRGWIERLYCHDDLGAAGVSQPIAQMNRSYTVKQGTIRGLHFQKPPSTETKIIYCIRGSVLDVAVDLRSGSPSWCQHFAVELSADNSKGIIIPEGCAHGFQTLTDDVELLYLHTAPYTPDAEGGIHPFDETLQIKWPLPVESLSQRDGALPKIADGFTGIQL